MGWAERRNPRSEYNRKKGYKPTKPKNPADPEVVVEFNLTEKVKKLWHRLLRNMLKKAR